MHLATMHTIPLQ